MPEFSARSAGVSIELMSAVGVSDLERGEIGDLFARLVAGGAALGWVEPPAQAEIAELLAELSSASAAGEARAAIARTTVEPVGAAAAPTESGAAPAEPGAAPTGPGAVSAEPEAAATGLGAAPAEPGTSHARPRIVGFAYWTRYARPTHRPHVDVEKVAVDPRSQGQGIGAGLMNALIGSAKELDVEVITLDLRGDNAPAISLYQALGFERYGLLTDFVAVGDRRFDKLFYALDLRR